jgi:hypothetical protein
MQIKVRWGFRKILWPSKNIRTLTNSMVVRFNSTNKNNWQKTVLINAPLLANLSKTETDYFTKTRNVHEKKD